MGFFSSLFGGQNKTLNTAIPQAGQASQFATGLGEALTTKAGGWLSGLLSGDATKTAQLLNPQISAAKERTQQGKKSMAEFGSRSGGTAASSAAADTTTRGDITKMTSDLTGQAIGQGMQAGQSLLTSGMNFLNQQVDFSQQQIENWSNSILGQGMAQGAGFAEKAGLNALVPGASAATDSPGGGALPTGWA